MMLIHCMKDWGKFKKGNFYQAELQDFTEVADWETGKLIQSRRMCLKTECGLEIAIAEVTEDWEFVNEDFFSKQWKERNPNHLERMKFEWWNHFEIVVKNLFYIEIEIERP